MMDPVEEQAAGEKASAPAAPEKTPAGAATPDEAPAPASSSEGASGEKEQTPEASSEATPPSQPAEAPGDAEAAPQNPPDKSTTDEASAVPVDESSKESPEDEVPTRVPSESGESSAASPAPSVVEASAGDSSTAQPKEPVLHVDMEEMELVSENAEMLEEMEFVPSGDSEMLIAEAIPVDENTPVTAGLPVNVPVFDLEGFSIEVPPPVVPPRGLAGIFDDYDPSEILDTSKFPPNMVLCNVYDIGDKEDELFQKVNRMGTGNNNLLIGGIFHAGIEVYGAEWCYGAAEEGLTGICHIVPRTNQQHSYRTTVPLGLTKLTDVEVSEICERMAPEWLGCKYHLLHYNCLTYANAFCEELGVRRIPGWVDRIARTASFLETQSRSAATGVRKTAELARSVSREIEETAQSFGSELERTVSAEAEEAQTFIDETIEVVKRESIRAMEVAQESLPKPEEIGERAKEIGEIAQAQVHAIGEKVRAQTQELGEKAQSLIPEEVTDIAQELGDKAQAQAQVLKQTVAQAQAQVQAGARELGETFDQKAQELQSKAQEILGEDLTGKAQELHGKAQEQAQALGSSLTRWASDLQKAAARALGDEAGQQGRRAAQRDPWGLLPAAGLFAGTAEFKPPSRGAAAAQEAPSSAQSKGTPSSASAELGASRIAADKEELEVVAVEDQE